ncbi:MAG: response regulator [Flavipsychrobacter sp.]|nr:response regulator [Flavipsychrobacter sp.]
MTDTSANDLRLVVIDDDQVILTLTSMMLRTIDKCAEISCFSKPARDINEIVTLVTNATKRTIIFLDINMPDINGWEVLDVIAHATAGKLSDNVRIYMLSSSINTSDKVKAYSNPLISGFFEKPLLQEDLRNLLFGEHVASMDRLWVENTERRRTEVR